MDCRWYKEVPRELVDNLAYRVAIRKRAAVEPRFRAAIMKACAQDFLYWLGTFCFLQEPRVVQNDKGEDMPTVMPFIPWPHQENPIMVMRENLGRKDIGVEKSRAQGVTCFAVLLALHDWLFRANSWIGFVTRTEDQVDSPNNPGSLFAKLDWQLKMLPQWMVGKQMIGQTKGDWHRDATLHTLSNRRNGSIIKGFSCTRNVARGERYYWFLVDEMASWTHDQQQGAMAALFQVTQSRLIVSTPNGRTGKFYEIMHRPSSMIKVVIDWKDNPWHNRGLYRFVGGRMIEEDPVGNSLPKGYEENSKELIQRLKAKGFKLDGELRSPWYDSECDKADATPQTIAAELDRDYAGSAYHIFSNEFYQAATASVRNSPVKGVINFDMETVTPNFQRGVDGPMQFWCSIDPMGRPPVGHYVGGVDISAGIRGSHSSNSVIIILSVMTGEQVFEFATNSEEPKVFAETCVAVCKFFNNAFLAWEANYGSGFRDRVIELGYTNCYRRTVRRKFGTQKTKDLGVWTDSAGRENSKNSMFGNLALAVIRHEVFLRSEPLVRECGEYQMVNGEIVHMGSRTTSDHTGRGKAHGDRVVAAAIAYVALSNGPRSLWMPKEREYGDPLPGSVEERDAFFRKLASDRDEEWDDRGNSMRDQMMDEFFRGYQAI